jgi:polyhydroxybutyrate depolymerase
MKKLLFTLFVFIYFAQINAQTNNSYTITSGGVARSYILYVPAIYNPSVPTPLVFEFHGYTSSNTQQEYYGDFRSIADTANFIIALPQGLTYNGNTGFANFGTVAQASVDINFTRDMIDTISAHYNINPCKIYSTGMSNGGFMSYDLGCFLSSRFAAIASVSGSMMSNHVSACNPLHPVPVIQFHGTSDATVSYTGTGGIVSSIDVDTLIKRWVSINNCNTTPAFTAMPNINTSDNCTAEHYVYNNGNANSTVEFFKIIGGGHSWPGSPYPISGVNTNQDVNACKEIWRFFRNYCLTNLMDVTEIEKQNINFSLYPNPSNGILNFSLNKSTADFLNIQVLDILGKTVLMENTSNNYINVEKLNAGIYFLYIQQNNKNLAKVKFIKE